MTDPTPTHRDSAADGLQREVDVHFDAVAGYWRDLYADDTLFARIHQERRRRTLAWIDDLAPAAGTRVLEVGCGAGLLAVDLAARGLRVDCIDPAEEMLQLARRGVQEAGVTEAVTVEVGDAHALAAADEAYALVVALGVMPFLHTPQLALAEIRRVLRAGGHFIGSSDNLWRLSHMIDPQFTPPLRPLVEGTRRRLGAVGVLSPPHGIRARRYSRTRFRHMLIDADLRPTRETFIGFGPFQVVGRRLLSDARGLAVDARLQRLADRGTPGLRSMGSQHLVLAVAD